MKKQKLKERKINPKSHITLHTSHNSGITLVALIITIIVLLILAVVAIRAVQGDGIIIKAKEAKSATEKAQAEEEIMLALNEWKILKNISTETLEDFLVSKFEDDNVIDNGDDTYTVIVNDYEAIIDKDGNIVGETEKSVLRPVVDGKSIKITTDGTTVPEEEGLAKGTPVQIYFDASIKGGEITSIEPNVPYTTNGTEMSKEFTIKGTVNGEEYTTTKTISVAKYYLDHSEKIVQTIAKTGVFDNANIAEVREGNIPIPTGFTYVKGDKDGGAVITDGTSEFVWIPVTSTIVATNASGFREPDVVTGVKPSSTVDSASGSGYDALSSNLNDAGFTEDLNKNGTVDAYDFKIKLTSEFNKMAESANKYHGFYVGRYETSFDGTTAKSKAGEDPMNSINWYAMYKNSKTYAPESSNKSVVSQMIWGSQWDAMMNYIKTTADASHASADNNVSHNLSAPYKTGGIDYTGSVKYNDKAANIYDLEGNVIERTQKAFTTSYRYNRGGAYNFHFSPGYGNYDYEPGYAYAYLGSRLALYIK